MGGSDLKLRTKEYALGIIRLFSELPKRTEVQILGRELFRSATSVGAQYREATWGKSNADFISKIEGSLQELEESEYWLELLAESGFYPEYRLRALKDETSELKGIFVTMSEAPKPSLAFSSIIHPRLNMPDSRQVLVIPSVLGTDKASKPDLTF